jgi:hypothetical protein
MKESESEFQKSRSRSRSFCVPTAQPCATAHPVLTEENGRWTSETHDVLLKIYI